MPATTAMFAVGALGAAALTPGNGFVSEWLLLQALVHAVPSGGVVTAVAMPLAVAVVALTAGLAVRLPLVLALVADGPIAVERAARDAHRAHPRRR